MNLNNNLPIPAGLRLCYWHSDYVAENQNRVAEKFASVTANFGVAESPLSIKPVDSCLMVRQRKTCLNRL